MKQNTALAFRTKSPYAAIDRHNQQRRGAVQSTSQSVSPVGQQILASDGPPLSARIPLYAADGSLVCHVDDDLAASIPGAIITRTRRGHIKRVQLRPLTCHVVPLATGRKGQAFEQGLSQGRVWALRGVEGSEP